MDRMGFSAVVLKSLCRCPADLRGLTDSCCVIEGGKGIGGGHSLSPSPECDALNNVTGVNAGLDNGVHQLVVVHLLLLSLALARRLVVS